MNPSWTQFLRFLLVGGVVGIATLAARELIALLLPGDTPAWYLLSTGSAYALGIAAGFPMQRRFAFDAAPGVDDLRRLVGYAAVAVLGALVAMLVSAGIRYGLPLHRWLGEFGASAAFAVGALSAAGVCYLLNLNLVFVSSGRRRD